MIETEIKIKSPLKTRDLLWFVILYQLMVHLVSHWDHYNCGSNFNVILLSIYIIHLLRRIVNYLGRSKRSKVITWIGYSFILPIQIWCCVTAYYLHQYQEELTDYSSCSSFFITLTFVVYGFIVSIYQIIKIVKHPNQNYGSEVDEEFLGRVSSAS